MRGTLFSFGVSLLFALPMNAQEPKAQAPVQVCVASAECFGPWCAQRQIAFPERELVAKKLNSGAGALKLEARDEGYRERPGCSLEPQKRSCDYLVLVKPVEVNRSAPVPRSQIQAEQLSPAQAPAQQPQSPNAQMADERQQEPLDQSSIRFYVIRLRDCQQVHTRELKRLEGSSAPPSAESVDWLTSKAAEQVRKAIAKDMKQTRP